MPSIDNADPVDPANAAGGATNEEEVAASTESTAIPYPSLPDDYFENVLSEVDLDGTLFDTEDKFEGHNLNSWATTKFPGLSGLNESGLVYKDKSRIQSCLQLGNSWRHDPNADPEYITLTRTFKRRPTVKKALDLLDITFLTMEVVQKDGIIAAIRPHQKRIKALGRYLGEVATTHRAAFITEGLPIPTLPQWADSNDLAIWWLPEEFEIIATCYRKDAEDFMGKVAPHCPNRFEESEPIAVPATPGLNLGSISANPRQLRFSSEIPDADFVSNSAFLGNILKGQPPINTSARSRPPAPPSISSEEDLNIPFNYRTPASRTHKRHPEGFSRFDGAPDPSDGSDSDSSPSHRAFGSNRGRGSRRPPSRPDRSAYAAAAGAPGAGDSFSSSNKQSTYHFDMKLKPESVPQWDGNDDLLARWMDKVNSLSYHSEDIHRELGKIVPRRFTGLAETWYWSIPPAHRVAMEQSWTTLKLAMHNYWMNSQWLERQKLRANLARFREAAHSRELPSAYVVRKLDLLRIVYDWSDTETIRQIMSEAPSSWSPILQPQFCNTIVEFQNAVKYHEDNLVHASNAYNSNTQASSSTARPAFIPNRNNFQRARTNLVGWSKDMPPPEYPKDDSNVSRNKTPESIGARACRHCGSGKHWDKECKHARQGERRARTNFVEIQEESLEAQDQYDELYYGSDTEQDF